VVQEGGEVLPIGIPLGLAGCELLAWRNDI
jgi:hypothetical protein